ncbi:MAG: NADH-quinone oxidoreductase subunit J [Burkholderiales bacterium]|nr:NADH-quinone oxidoreductase subunit J [Phycisphaerae bacterium]
MVDPQTAFPVVISSLLAEVAGTSAQAATGPSAASAITSPVSPGAVVALCIVAGLATWLMLPGKREIAIRRVGAVILTAAALISAALLMRWTAAQGGMGAYFWIFSAIALVSSIRVITHTKPVYSALYFVLTVFATAGLFVLMWAEFMAAALVLIYAGAILITYVFVIMLASEAAAIGAGDNPAGTIPPEQDGISRSPLLASAVGFVLAGLLVYLILDKRNEIHRDVPHAATVAIVNQSGDTAHGDKAPGDTGHREELASAPALGKELVENHSINLQLSAILLTLAMVGAITLARRRVIVSEQDRLASVETVVVPGTPTDDNPHSILVYGTTNPRHKAYPEN